MTREPTEYPEPPWRLRGQFWSGIFRTVKAIRVDRLPVGTRAIFANRLAIAAISYQSESLCYDELIITVPVWQRGRPRLWIRDIWVSEEFAKWGGIHIWNVPKKRADFSWREDSVQVEDHDGAILQLSTPNARFEFPWLMTVIPFLGAHQGEPITSYAWWSGSLAVTKCKPTILRWSDRFEDNPLAEPTVGFMSSSFKMTVKAPR